LRAYHIACRGHGGIQIFERRHYSAERAMPEAHGVQDVHFRIDQLRQGTGEMHRCVGVQRQVAQD
jgi:hypothetical protein